MLLSSGFISRHLQAVRKQNVRVYILILLKGDKLDTSQEQAKCCVIYSQKPLIPDQVHKYTTLPGLVLLSVHKTPIPPLHTYHCWKPQQLPHFHISGYSMVLAGSRGSGLHLKDSCHTVEWISFKSQVHLRSLKKRKALTASMHIQLLHDMHKQDHDCNPHFHHSDIMHLSWNCFWTISFFSVVKINPLPECQGVLLRMYNVSELSDFPIFLFIVHVWKISIFRSNRKGIVTTAYEIHCSCSITASLQQ